MAMGRKLILCGLVTFGGLALGSTVSVLNQPERFTPDEIHQANYPEIMDILSSEESLRKTPLIFYKFTTCPHSRKLQAVLDYFKLGYSPVEVNPMTKQEIKANNYGGVPQLSLGDSKYSPLLVESTPIIDLIYPVLNHRAPTSAEEQYWVQWAQEHLIDSLIWNSHLTLSDSLSDYNYVESVDSFTPTQKFAIKWLGSPLKHFIVKYAVKKRLPPEVLSDPRKALEEQISLWSHSGLKSQQFHGGDRPDRADLEIYGIVTSKRGQPVYNEIISKSDPAFQNWIQSMDSVVSPQNLFEKQ